LKITNWILIHVYLLQFVVTPLVQAQEIQNQTKRIALVDFRNLTGDESLDRYRKSVPDQIQTVLAGTGTMRLVERGQLEAALTELNLGMNAIIDDQTAVRLGKVLQANAIITGSYHKEGNTLQFTARVIEVETSEVITGVVERCQIGGDVFSAIDQVASALIEQLRIHKWSDIIFQPPPEITEGKKGKKTLLWVGLGALVVAGTAIAVLAGGGASEEGGPTTPAVLMDPPVRPGN
jgi:TolB-like protein